MTGREVRSPGQPGERWRERRERRTQASRERRGAYWSSRISAARTPLQLLRVVTDRLTTAVVQRERRAAVAYEHTLTVHHPRSAQAAAARARLEAVRAEIAADLASVTDAMAALADKHETPRA